MTDNTQPEALRLADEVDEVARTYPDMAEVSAGLRRQHARIAELEAQLEAIGAGGVSGPLMGQPQAMPDLSALTERGAKAWAGVDARGLRDGVANAGREPVAPSGWREAIGEIRAGLEDSEPSGCDNSGYRAFAGTVLDAVEDALAKLVTHPSPAEGAVTVPANAEDVRAFIGSQYETLEYGHQDGDEAHENDRYTLTVHDLLSAFRWWAETRPSPPEGMVGGWIASKDQMPPPGVRVFWGDVDSHRVGYDSWAGDDYRWAPSHWMHIPEFHAPPTTSAGSGKGE